MTIPIPRLPFFALAVLFLLLSLVMKLISRGDPGYWLNASGVCALLALAGG